MYAKQTHPTELSLTASERFEAVYMYLVPTQVDIILFLKFAEETVPYSLPLN